MSERKGRERERERGLTAWQHIGIVGVCVDALWCRPLLPPSTLPLHNGLHTPCVCVYIPPPFTTHRLVPSLSTTARSLCTWSRAPRFSTYTLLVLQPAIRFVLVHSSIPFRSSSIDRLGDWFTAAFSDRRSSEQIAAVDRLGKATLLGSFVDIRRRSRGPLLFPRFPNFRIFQQPLVSLFSWKKPTLTRENYPCFSWLTIFVEYRVFSHFARSYRRLILLFTLKQTSRATIRFSALGIINGIIEIIGIIENVFENIDIYFRLSQSTVYVHYTCA